MSRKLEAEVSLLKCLTLRSQQLKTEMEELKARNKYLTVPALKALEQGMNKKYEELSSKQCLLCDLLQALKEEKGKISIVLVSAI